MSHTVINEVVTVDPILKYVLLLLLGKGAADLEDKLFILSWVVVENHEVETLSVK